MAIAVVSELLTPMEIIAEMVVAHNWNFDCSDENQITIFVEGRYSEYEVAFNWFEDKQLLHIACAFEVKMTKRHLAQLRELMRLINESEWVGHFEYMPKIGMVLYRHALVCPPGELLSPKQIYAMLDAALKACEENHPAFTFVLEDKLAAAEAFELNIKETQGNA